MHWQLPADLSDFVGREEVIADICDRLRKATTMPVVIVSGPPGVGKSALAVRVGHRLRADFPDGHWHVRLAGASGSPREPLDVLGELLGLAGIDPYELPAEVDPRAALLRSTLADRRVLLVLDDARDTRQVRSLLPGTAGNAVLVTSRNDLTGLSVAVGARGTRLRIFDPIESTDLLGGMLGADRVADEPVAAAELAELCDHLPLALRIAAGLLAAHPGQSLADYAEELRTGDRLTALAIAGEPDSAVATSFALSYESLPPLARRLFALLGLVPGGDLTSPAAAALIGCTPREVGPLLDTLTSANLLQRERSRYRMHDLIRLYAACRAKVEPGATEAWERLANWYLLTTDAAVDFAYRPYIRMGGQLFDENPFQDAVDSGRLHGLEWHEAAGLNALGTACHGQGQWDEAVLHHGAARDIAVRLRHRATEAEAYLGLAVVALTRDDLDGALVEGRKAWSIADELHLRIVECRAALVLAEASRRAGDLGEAERLGARATAIKAATGYVPASRIG